MAFLRSVKNFVGHGTLVTPRVKFAITRSTGDRPRRAILDAADRMPNTARASLATVLVVAMSTSIGRLASAEMRFTS